MSTNKPKSSTKSFVCTFCPKSYVCKFDLREHLFQKHDERGESEGECKSFYHCEKCLENNQPTKYFSMPRFLNRHMKQVHGLHDLKCPVCFKTFTTQTNFRKHQLIHSSNNRDKKHKCDLCSISFHFKQDLQKHLFCRHKKKTAGLKYFKCELCPREYVNKTYLESHVVEKHVVDKSFECSVCSKTLIDQEALDKHMMIRHDKPMIQFCDICSIGFKNKTSLVHHLKIEHKKFFYCAKCLRSFGQKSEFDQHSEPKTSSKMQLDFKCQICSEGFDSQCLLDIHTNYHLKEINSKETSILKK